MTRIGFTLSSEEHDGTSLVRYAGLAEAAGFDFVSVSDHFHPWTDRQGQSPFVWAVLGGIAARTERIQAITGVTCPLIRIHPAIVAQASATVAQMMPGRFSLGLGTGENLNEHVTGARWPAIDQRLDMLSEAIGVIRELWTGKDTTHRGEHYTVEQARIYTTPDSPPPLLVAAKGEKAATLAAEKGDGLVGAGPDADLLKAFEKAGGSGPRYGQFHACWAPDKEQATKTAHEWWPNAAIKGELSVELPLPRHFEQATQDFGPADVAESVTLGPDPEKHLDTIREYADAGYDHVYVHQIGPDQEEAIAFYQREVLPKLG
jgi:G6PDH family F420-dependent oxidoreductase